MNLISIRFPPVNRWLSAKGMLFALFGLLALDGGLCVTSASAALQLSPSSLTFTAQQNGANPAPQTINLSKSGPNIKTWTMSPSVSWLTISPTSGTISTETDLIVVGANVAGLFVHLMPVFGVMLAWLILDERLAPFHVAGIALILCGIYITSRYAPIAVPAGTD